MKVLYIYSGSRKDKFKGVIGKDYPDTQFYGLNHLSKFGIDAEFREFSDIISSAWLQKKIPFSIKHGILVLKYSLFGNYDIIFGSSLLYGLFLKKIFRLQTKCIILDISLGRTLYANKHKKIKYAFLVWLLKSVDGIVCLSNLQKENLENKLPFLKGKVFFVPLGVDANYHAPKYEGRSDYALSVGRDNGRDYKTVIKTAEKMEDKRFKIICSKRNLEGLGTPPSNVEVIFDLPPLLTYDEYGKAEELLLLTHGDEYADGSDCSGQTVLLEAMACGLPVIISAKKYLSDYLADGKDALLVNFYDENDVSQKLAQFRNPEFRRAIATGARRAIEQKYTTEKMAEKLAKIFKQLHE